MILEIILCVAVTAQAFPPMANPNLFEGDLVLSPAELEAIKRNVANQGNNQFAAISTNSWPSTTIPWSASPEILSSKKAMTAIKAALEEYHTKSCLKFPRRTNEKSYIYFYKGEGCHSRVGYFGVNKISLDTACQNKGTVVHEMYHSLGFYHEQSRPDRDNFVKIIWKNIPLGAKNNFQKYTRSVINSMGVPYDYLSVSHYRKDQFTPGSLQIETLDKSMQDKIGSQQQLSVLDVKQLAMMYRCDGTKTLPPTLIPPTPRPQFCEDENGLSYCKGLKSYCNRAGSLQKTLKKQCYKTCGYC